MKPSQKQDPLKDKDTLELLRLAAEGETNKKIAPKLCKGKDWLDKRRTEIFKALGARNITQAVAIAIRRNLIK
jgi:DNA-binding NarL/FixJ family response regulator